MPSECDDKALLTTPDRKVVISGFCPKLSEVIFESLHRASAVPRLLRFPILLMLAVTLAQN